MPRNTHKIASITNQIDESLRHIKLAMPKPRSKETDEVKCDCSCVLVVDICFKRDLK